MTRMSTRCSYYRRIAITAAALLMTGCGSSSEKASPKPHSADPAATGLAGTRPTPPRSSTVNASFAEVGGWIAYAGEGGIWAVDPAHPDRRVRLTDERGDPIAWSSDGTKLLIRRRSSYRSVDLYVLEANGNEKRVTSTEQFGGTLGGGGSFSPDGAQVVYAEGRLLSAIYGVSLDGGDGRLILRSTRRVSFEDGHTALASAYQPAMSPDGTRIAYFDGMYDSRHNLRVATVDGTEGRVILDDEVFPADHVNSLVWAPDGKWLAFSTDSRAYLVRPDGTGLRQLVSSSFITAPAVQWSRDGSRIAYLRTGDTCTSVTGNDEDFVCDAGQLHIVNVDGSGEQVIEGLRTPMNALIAWNPRM